MSRLCTDGKVTTHLDNNLPVCNVKNIQLVNDERHCVHICSDCDFERDENTDTPEKDPTEKREPKT